MSASHIRVKFKFQFFHFWSSSHEGSEEGQSALDPTTQVGDPIVDAIWGMNQKIKDLLSFPL